MQFFFCISYRLWVPDILLMCLFVSLLIISNYYWHGGSFKMLRVFQYYFTPCKIITPVLADGFPLESEGQQVFSNLPDSSQYSGQSQQSASLHGLNLSSDFQLFPYIFPVFEDRFKCTSYNWYHHHRLSQLT